MLQGLTPDVHRGLLLSVGSHKGTRPLSPTEVAQGLQDSLTAGTPPKDLAAALHLNGPSMISRFVRLLELPPPVLHLVDWGQTKSTIAFTAASELSRLRSKEEQLLLCKSALEAGLTSTEVKAVVQMRLRSKKPLTECIDAIVNLRSSVIRRHVFVGAVTLDDVRTGLSAMHQIDRDQLMQAVLTKLLPAYPEISGRLGQDRFTLSVENEAAANAIVGLQGGFEVAISNAISPELSTRKA